MISDHKHILCSTFCHHYPVNLSLIPSPFKSKATSHLVLIFGYWVIPAENIVAAFQDSQITVFAISKSPSEAQIFLEIQFIDSKIRTGMNFTYFKDFLDYLIFLILLFRCILISFSYPLFLFVGPRARPRWCYFKSWGCRSCSWAKVNLFYVRTCLVVKHCFLSYKNYQDYFDRRNEVSNLLSLTKATVTRVQVAGMGDCVCVDLCCLLRPGERLLVCFHFLISNSIIMIYCCAW